MKKVTIKELRLSSWRAQNKIVNFGHVTEISGRNETGKSSIKNAFLWLITGYDEFDRANYQLFDNTVENTYENSKPASVEGVFEIDGNKYTFKKTAKQGWHRPRGRTDYERTGSDDYSFHIDGITVSSTQYKQKIEELFAPMTILKIMLNTNYFLLLDWKELRKHLEFMVGEISISEFKGDYSNIYADLNQYTTESLTLSYKSKIRPIKASIESIPITIESLQANLPDLSGVNDAEKAIYDAKQKILEIEKVLIGASDLATPYIEKRNAELKKLSDLRTEFAEAKKIYERNFYDQLDKIEDEMRAVDEFNASVDDYNKKIEKDTESNKKELEKLEELLVGLQKRHEELTQQNRECKARIFVGEKCTYCGQELPEDKLEEARRRFNEQKESDHAYIVLQGKANREVLDRTLKAIEELKKKIDNPSMPKKYKDKTVLHDKINAMERSFIPYEETTEGKAKVDKIKEKEANLTVVPQQDNSVLINEKQLLLNTIEVTSRKLGIKDEYARQKKQIETLQAELKQNAIELAILEGKLAKVKEFEEEKANIISERVNGLFKYIHIEMYETNKSGNITPTCVVKDQKGVNVMVTNNASRIMCGIDISLAFQKHFNLELPIFIDNFESINKNRMPILPNQVIKMIVSEDHFNCKIL